MENLYNYLSGTYLNYTYFKNRALLASIRSPLSDSSGCNGKPLSSAATASIQA